MDVPDGDWPWRQSCLQEWGYCVECLKGAFSRGYTCGSNPNYTCHYDAGKCRTCAPVPMMSCARSGGLVAGSAYSIRVPGKIERDRIVSAFLA